MQDETKSMNEYESYESEQEQLLTLMEQIQTQNEKLKAQQTEQSAKIQKLLSDKRELELTVQQQGKKIAEQAEQIEKLNESDKQLSEANRKLKEAEQKLKEAEKIKRNADETVSACNKTILKYQAKERNLDQQKEKEIKERITIAKNQIRNEYVTKSDRVIKFASSAISVLGIYAFIITAVWLENHKATIGNDMLKWFNSLFWGISSIANSIGNFYNGCYGQIKGSIGDFWTWVVLFIFSAVLCLVGGFGAFKGCVLIKEKWKELWQHYEYRRNKGFNAGMTVALCVVSVSVAVLFAELTAVNTITLWLIFSIIFNVCYHCFAYKYS